MNSPATNQQLTSLSTATPNDGALVLGRLLGQAMDGVCQLYEQSLKARPKKYQELTVVF